jgi:hypothetical protein
MMTYEYYYNNVPGIGLCRNNLIYTSLISKDKKVFCQWYHNDSEYHKGQNQIVDSTLMQAKWLREVNYLTQMRNRYPDLVPVIKNIDLEQQKIYLEIDGPDFWEQAGCDQENFDTVLPDWQEQMLSIIQAHKSLGLYKYSMHPSSYFIVDGKLKSINYFFTYNKNEGPVTVRDHLSHISKNRQEEMKAKTDSMGIDWDEPQSLHIMQMLTFESFRNNYPIEFIEKAKNVFAS